MTIFLSLFIIFSSLCLTSSTTLFDIQDTLHILCRQFPLISTINDSSLRCARLRIDENVPSTEYNLNNPSQIVLFIIIDQSSSDISPVNIIINFNQSSIYPSSINEIRLALLVIQSNFTLNNQTTPIYSSNDIPIIRWQRSIPNTYDLIDILHLKNEDYETDLSMCRWNADRWNHIFNGNIPNNMSYIYILKTTNTQLTFTLINSKKRLPAPLPYLNILYCIPYKLGTTELVITICFGAFFILFLVTLSILHYFRGENNSTRYLQREVQKNLLNSSSPILSVEHND